MDRNVVIAVVKATEYRAIHAWAAARDVIKGGHEDIYDAPTGGAINVWGRDGWEKPDGHIHCTYYPERTDGQHLGETLAALLGDSTRLTVLRDGRHTVVDLRDWVLKLALQDVDWVFVLYEPGTHGGDVYRTTDPHRWGHDKDWTAAMAQDHFAAMYEAALGQPLPASQRLPLTPDDKRD